MSADNGIYIFPIHRMVTGVSTLQGYYVSYMSAVDNVSYKADHPDGYNHEFCQFESRVLKKPLFKTKTEALVEADRQAEGMYLEYGIQTMDPYILDEALMLVECLLCKDGIQHSNCTTS